MWIREILQVCSTGSGKFFEIDVDSETRYQGWYLYAKSFGLVALVFPWREFQFFLAENDHFFRYFEKLYLANEMQSDHDQ